jgi:hypothetical protein
MFVSRALPFGSVTLFLFALACSGGSDEVSKGAALHRPDAAAWLFAQKLTASDAATSAGYGTALAAGSDTVAVGSPSASVSGAMYAGAVYVYSQSGSSFVEQAKLAASDAATSQNFGSALALSGDTLAVGAPYANVAGKMSAGAVYIFERSGSVWTQKTKLVASDAGDNARFGASLAIEGNTLLVGSPSATVSGLTYVGTGYLFARSSGVWSETAKLNATAARQYDQVGSSVALSGNTAVLGAPGVNIGGYLGAGAAVVFVNSGGTWTQQAQIDCPSTVFTRDRAVFGRSLAVLGDTLAVASQYSDDYVFVRSGTSWSEQQHFSRGDSIALAPDSVVAGRPSVPSSLGDAYVMTRSGTTWTEMVHLQGVGAARGDKFGAAVAHAGSLLAISSPGAEVGMLTDAGAVYVYTLGMARANGQACAMESECSGAICVDGVCCDSYCGSGSPNDCQACSTAMGAAVDGTCGVVKMGVICRPQSDLCDVADACDGTSMACSTDKMQARGTLCRAAAGPCDVDETCLGTDKKCPANTFKGSSTMCRAAAGACDAAEYCSGTEANCPSDRYQPTFSTCRAAAGPCDAPEYCSGFTIDCPMDKFSAAGTNCRSAAGPCDTAESCTGTSAACPSDTFLPATSVCRASAKDCDAPEYCSGVSSACPTDGQAGDGAVCSMGSCEKGICRPQADLQVQLLTDTQVVKANQAIRFTAIVRNQGRGEAMPVALTLSYPPTAALSELGGPGFGCQSATGGAVCTLDKLPAGQNATLSMVLVAPGTQTIFNVAAQAKSAIPDPKPEDNFVTLLVKNEEVKTGDDLPIPPSPPPSAGGCSLGGLPSDGGGLRGLVALGLVLGLWRRRGRKDLIVTDKGSRI